PVLAPPDPIFRSRTRTPLVRAVRRSLVAAQLAGAEPLVVGCSGGPDSTALLLALCLLREPRRLHVVAIDHGLRRESAAEAEAVRALAERLGAGAEIVAVKVGRGASRMALSREARYAALGEIARRIGARFVAVGHTRDDQAETVLMRLLGGAGLTGLSGMATVAEL